MTGELVKALVVDDDESVRNIIRRFLEGAGYSVTTATDGVEALEKVSQQDITVVLLDISMPGMSGTEVLQRLSESRPDICVLMVTAVVDTKTAVESMKMGAYDYITKPFEQDDVIEKIRKAVEKRKILLDDNKRRIDLEKKIVEQTEQLRKQFVELVETLAREHKLIYEMAEQQRGGIPSFLKKLPKELRKPMSSVEEFSEALLRILKNEAVKPDGKPDTDTARNPKR